METGTLYVVATPIGNLGDITLRALDMLRSCDVVAAEDTRKTRALLTHYEIKKPLVSYHEHSCQAREQELLRLLAEGKSVALATDAGTPVVSDPGLPLIRLAREAGFTVVGAPGACAAVYAASLSARCGEGFAFVGFCPAKKAQRQKFLRKYADVPLPLVLYEAPHRVCALLEDVAQVYGSDSRVTVARELTKLHEEFKEGSADELLAYYRECAPRGEFTLVVEKKETQQNADDENLVRCLSLLLSYGTTKKNAAELASEILGVSKNAAYQLALTL